MDKQINGEKNIQWVHSLKQKPNVKNKWLELKRKKKVAGSD